MDSAPIKIAIVTPSLAHGGAERSAGLLSLMLSQPGFEVHVITILDGIEFPYQGQLLNLGLLKNKNDTVLGRFERLLVWRKYFKRHNFDWIIDHRMCTSTWSELIISRFVYNPRKAIYVVHSFLAEKYFPKNNAIARRIYKPSPYIVAVSDEINAKVRAQFGYSNVKTIHNAIDPDALATLASAYPVTGNFVLAYGRINDAVKNFSLLLDAYAVSALPQMNIALYLLGDGPDVALLQQKAKALNLSEKIVFIGKQTNPFPYVKAAKFTLLTSRNEGFPMVLIESLALQTPVVSVDCHSGPAEVIRNAHNGLLVPNNNIEALAAAMSSMAEDPELYSHCKAQAQQSVAHLSIDAVSQKWAEILTAVRHA